MYPPSAQFPFFVLQLNSEGQIMNTVAASDGVIPNDKQFSTFAGLIDVACTEKAKLFFENLVTNGAELEWELSFNLRGFIEVFTASGFKTGDTIFVMVSGCTSGALMMYEEMSLINNEQLNSIRVLRKQLNQMATENNLLRAELNAELDELKNEIKMLKSRQKHI